MPKFAAQLSEARVLRQCRGVAIAVEVDVQDALDVAGTHEEDAIRQQNRLVDVVGDEHGGLAPLPALPKIEQKSLQLRSAVLVQRSERLI